jgi:hypothetical protein
MKKYAIHFVVALLVGVFRAFVLMNLWNWFVTAVFHVSEISFLQVLGLSLVIQVFTGDRISGEKVQWDLLMRTLEHCVPEERREALKEELKEAEEGMGLELGMMILSQFLSLLATLAFGFVIHILVG